MALKLESARHGAQAQGHADPERHRPLQKLTTIEGLGLTRMHKSVVAQRHAAIRGMIRKVSHLVTVEARRSKGHGNDICTRSRRTRRRRRQQEAPRPRSRLGSRQDRRQGPEGPEGAPGHHGIPKPRSKAVRRRWRAASRSAASRTRFREEVVRGQRRRRSRSASTPARRSTIEALKAKGLVPRSAELRQDPRRRRADQEAHGHGALLLGDALRTKIEKAGGKRATSSSRSRSKRSRTRRSSKESRRGLGIANIAKIPELRQRILFTLALLAVYRVGVFVTIPGVEPRRDEARRDEGGSGSFLGLFNMFSGGALEQLSIFALGIMPYISASIILQLLDGRRAQRSSGSSKEGEQGQQQDQPVHALRHDRAVAGPGVLHRHATLEGL